MSCAATTGPTPTCSSRLGATRRTSASSCVSSSAASSWHASARRAVVRNAISRGELLGGLAATSHAGPRTCGAALRAASDRSRSRRLAGALTTRACSAAIARVRNSIAGARVARSTRIASRSPRQRGSLTPIPAIAWRAARTASMSSLFTPARRAGRCGRSTSTTCSPLASSSVVRARRRSCRCPRSPTDGAAVTTTEREETPIARRVRRHGHVLEDGTDRSDGAARCGCACACRRR